MADATNILDAVKTLLKALYPTIGIRVTKRAGTEGTHGDSGHHITFPLPCLIISCDDPERIDSVGDFENVSVGYRVLVEYAKNVQAAVRGPEGEPGTVAEDSDIRDKRQAIRGALYRDTLAGTSVFHCTHTTKPVYQQNEQNKAIIVFSGEEFTYFTLEPRA